MSLNPPPLATVIAIDTSAEMVEYLAKLKDELGPAKAVLYACVVRHDALATALIRQTVGRRLVIHIVSWPQIATNIDPITTCGIDSVESV